MHRSDPFYTVKNVKEKTLKGFILLFSFNLGKSFSCPNEPRTTFYKIELSFFPYISIMIKVHYSKNLRNMISSIFGMWTLSGPAVIGHA